MPEIILVTEDEFNSHKADNTHVHWLGNATGTNALVATYAPITAYKDGLGVAINVVTDSTAATTLKINGLGVIPIIKSNGTNATLKKGVYTLRYVGGNFILQGEGGSGNASASDLLSGKTASVDAGDIVGTMVNRGAINQTITTQNGQSTIPMGYHNGTGKVTANITNLVAGNIKKGVNVGGVVGTAKAIVLTSPAPSASRDGYKYINSVNPKTTPTGMSHSPMEARRYTMNASGTILLVIYTQLESTGFTGTVDVRVNGVSRHSYTVATTGTHYQEVQVAVNDGDVVSVYIYTSASHWYIRCTSTTVYYQDDYVAGLVDQLY